MIWVQMANYWGGEEDMQFFVDKEVARDLQINLDITIDMPCDSIQVNVLDQSRDRLLVSELLSFEETEFDPSTGHHISQHQEYETLNGVLRRARKSKFRKHRAKQGGQACRVYGSFPVTRVQGDLHITAKGYGYPSERAVNLNQLSFSHLIDEFSFGEYYPKLVNPLDGVMSISQEKLQTYQYFMSVVRTIYTSQSTGYSVDTNQYAVTEQVDVANKQSNQPPGLFFKYDIEPIALTITDRRMPFTQFFVRLINILGGVVVCTGWLYKIFETSVTKLKGGNNSEKRGMLDKPITTSEHEHEA